MNLYTIKNLKYQFCI